eukprot:TRINITY_DN2849_c0_g2_i1.p1 TRINITY_DN2849_c0_g2~~TRINITY_DN2849_c0_g2_i1.p1  ORF type:complete len:483 (+),score=99.68 TRINITY_DN2849_c0_g2_i1:35-1483(+)
MKYFLFTVLLLLILVQGKNIFTRKNSFNEFMELHHREYSSASEYLSRKKLFKERYSMVKDINNPILDRTVEELNGFSHPELFEFLEEIRKPQDLFNTVNSSVSSISRMTHDDCYDGSNWIRNITYWKPKDTWKDVPEEFTWRDKYNFLVRDQGEIGSCFAQSSAAVSEFYLKKHTGKQVYLSAQDILCRTGTPNGGQAYRSWSESTKVEDPYSFKTQCQIPYDSNTDACVDVNMNYSIHASCYGFVQDLLLDSSASNEDMMAALVNLGPISVVVNAEPWMSYTKEMGILRDCPAGLAAHSRHLHAVVLVGYKKVPGETAYWEVLNSWGTGWGLDGYIRLAMDLEGWGDQDCGIRELPSVPSFSSEECANAHYPFSPSMYCEGEFTIDNTVDVESLPETPCVKFVPLVSHTNWPLIIFLFIILFVICAACLCCCVCCCRAICCPPQALPRNQSRVQRQYQNSYQQPLLSDNNNFSNHSSYQKV